jgi:hypothetical protein
VLGRPLDQIRPARATRPKPKVATNHRPTRVAASHKAATRPATAPVAVAPPAAPAPALAAVQQPAPVAPPHAPKQALDDRADPQARIADNVGQGPRAGAQPAAPGIYLGSREQAVVRRFYAAHPAPGPTASWKIGEPVPAGAKLKGVPDEVRAALPQAPGHQYVEVNGEVLLVAERSRVVVDGVSRNAR